MQSNKSKKPHTPENLTYSQPFSATVIKSKSTGLASLELYSQQYYQHQLNKFDEGEKVTLTISNRKPKRSLQQNSYYWGVYLPLIASETGERNLDRLHELFKGKFLTEGIVEVLGEKVRIKKSTTKLSVSAFMEYVMAIAELTGIQAPPMENYLYDEDY